MMKKKGKRNDSNSTRLDPSRVGGLQGGLCAVRDQVVGNDQEPAYYSFACLTPPTTA